MPLQVVTLPRKPVVLLRQQSLPAIPMPESWARCRMYSTFWGAPASPQYFTATFRQLASLSQIRFLSTYSMDWHEAVMLRMQWRMGSCICSSCRQSWARAAVRLWKQAESMMRWLKWSWERLEVAVESGYRKVGMSLTPMHIIHRVSRMNCLSMSIIVPSSLFYVAMCCYIVYGYIILLVLVVVFMFVVVLVVVLVGVGVVLLVVVSFSQHLLASINLTVLNNCSKMGQWTPSNVACSYPPITVSVQFSKSYTEQQLSLYLQKLAHTHSGGDPIGRLCLEIKLLDAEERAEQVGMRVGLSNMRACHTASLGLLSRDCRDEHLTVGFHWQVATSRQRRANKGESSFSMVLVQNCIKLYNIVQQYFNSICGHLLYSVLAWNIIILIIPFQQS